MEDINRQLLDNMAAFLTAASRIDLGDRKEVEWKKTFVASLTLSILVYMIEKIEKGEVPEDWDGMELREWIADVAAREVFETNRKRKASYRNDIAVHNL